MTTWKELAELVPERTAPVQQKQEALIELGKIAYKAIDQMGFWGGNIDVSDWGIHAIVNGEKGAEEVRMRWEDVYRR